VGEGGATADDGMGGIAADERRVGGRGPDTEGEWGGATACTALIWGVEVEEVEDEVEERRTVKGWGKVEEGTCCVRACVHG
jgi:hypothetical protein